MIQLTQSEWLVYTTIVDYIQTHGHSPSTREVARATRRAYSATYKIIYSLVGYGVLRRYPSAPRKEAIELVDGVTVGVKL